ncbi:MAG TPA: dipeptide epimerase [Bacteroidia bacterium]|nr:dipeptide epimerase [Bacteroidia bacterium]
MTFALSRYYLEFKEPFSIAHGTRNGTDLVFLKLEHQGFVAWGEASLPPYLPETQQTVCDFLERFMVRAFDISEGLEVLLNRLMEFEQGNYAAKACADIAMHNLFAQMQSIPVWQLLGVPDYPLPLCTYTIGMGDKAAIRRKLIDAAGFKLLKVKLGGENDREIIRTIREETDLPLCADANQGWHTKEAALEMINFLAGQSVLFVEQPLPKYLHSEMKWLKEKSPLPLYADESVQTPADVKQVSEGFHGVNVKLMKCGGLAQGLKMIREARNYGLHVLIGSMSESGCGITAAAQLSSLADYADLDGPLLTKNNPFPMPVYKNGILEL